MNIGSVPRTPYNEPRTPYNEPQVMRHVEPRSPAKEPAWVELHPVSLLDNTSVYQYLVSCLQCLIRFASTYCSRTHRLDLVYEQHETYTQSPISKAHAHILLARCRRCREQRSRRCRDLQPPRQREACQTMAITVPCSSRKFHNLTRLLCRPSSLSMARLCTTMPLTINFRLRSGEHLCRCLLLRTI
jgi:hypothetical protein